MKTGIAIINYNRSNLLETLITKIKDSMQYHCADLIVADDGSRDDSASVCRRHGVRRIGSKNMGIAWNKNRGLYWFMHHSDCDNIIPIENDCLIESPYWISTWSEAVIKWGHVNCLPPSFIKKIKAGEECSEILGGTGTPDDPYLCTKISGICIGSRRDAIEKVGYLDTRFKGYGHEHTEWTLRFRRIGLGFKQLDSENSKINCNIMISGGVSGADVPSSSDKSSAELNRLILDECKKDSTYRNPWRNEDEKNFLIEEIRVSR